MSYETLLYETKDRVGVVTLNRPENLNGLAPGMTDDLIDVFHRMADDPEVLVSILTGAGRAFCAGAFVKDAKTHSLSGPGEAVLADTFRFFRAVDEYPKPLIAAVNGPAYGAGLNLVLLCDMILAAPEAKFCFPMTRLGIVPGFSGSSRLALFVGKAKASEMALMSRAIDGEEAHRWGLVNKVVPKEQLMDEAMAWATEITGLAPLAVRLAKEDLRQSLSHHMDVPANRLRFHLAEMTEDREEGHRAWREKRAPKFAGR